jgi:hypothetical protein
MRIAFFIALSLLLAPLAASAKELSSMTIELKGSAVFVLSDAKIIKEIEAWANGDVIQASADSGQIVKTLSSRFGSDIQIETFVTQELSSAAGTQEIRLPLRDAILSGRIPPVENLSMDDAAIVLATFGFSSVTTREFDALSDDQKLRRLLEADKALIVLEGTGPFSEMSMYYREESTEKHK